MVKFALYLSCEMNNNKQKEAGYKGDMDRTALNMEACSEEGKEESFELKLTSSN